MAARPLDLLVIGGGIVGAGVARDAAMRGLRIGLVEQYDFASGTSSKSSRLLHGGLRYLAQGRVGLAREAGREKRILRQIAPHLTRPLPFIFPTYKGTQWSLTKLRLGVKLYELLCGTSDYGRTGSLKAGEAIAMANVADANLTGGVRYFDSFTNDARLVMDTLASARRHKAAVLNYVQFIRAKQAGDKWLCQCRDSESGSEFDVETKCVVNATGPWSQLLEQSTIKLRLTKGVHLVVRKQRLPIEDAVVLAQGDRILFAIPWGQRVILGTTDTDYEGRVEDVGVDQADVDYILEVVNTAMPKARLTQSDVVSSWAGVRPLIASGNKKGGPSNISRRHVIRWGEKAGWIDVAGGKLTTYRHIAQEVVDKAVKYLNIPAPKSSTAREALISPEQAEGKSGLLAPPISQSLVEYYVNEEWARHLEDVMARRTSWKHYAEQPEDVARKVAGWMAKQLHWDAKRMAEELKIATTSDSTLSRRA